jgi:hypothetical protein
MSPRTSAPWSERSTSLARAQLLSTVSASSSLASSPGRARNGECAPGISVRSTPRRGFVTARLKLDGDRGVVDSSDGRAGSVRQLGQRVGTIPEAARVLRPQPLEGPGRILRVAVGVEGDPCGLERPENARPVTQGDGLVGLRPTMGGASSHGRPLTLESGRRESPASIQTATPPQAATPSLRASARLGRHRHIPRMSHHRPQRAGP